MTTEFTQADIARRIQQLTLPVTALDRSVVQDPELLLEGVKELIFRTLNADVDTVYYLMNMLALRNSRRTASILTWVDNLRDNAKYALIGSVSGDPSYVPEVADLFGQLSVSENADEAALLQGRLTAKVSEFKQSIRTSTGASLLGKTPGAARREMAEDIANVLAELRVLHTQVDQFVYAPSEYMQVPYAVSSRYRQAQAAESAMAGHRNTPESELQYAVLDAAISLALVGQRTSQRREIRTYKLEGVATNVAGDSASLDGGTLPIPLTAPGTAALAIGALAAVGTVSAVASDKPALSWPIPASLVRSGETGTLITFGGGSPGLDLRSAGGGDEPLPWLKNYVVPGSVTIYLTVDDGFGNPVNVVLQDDGASNLVSTPAAGAGTVTYSTGELLITLTLGLFVTSSAVAVYEFYPLGIFEARTGTPGAGPSVLDGSFDEARVFIDNVLETAPLASTLVTSTADLTARLQASVLHVPAGVDFTSSGNVIQAEGPTAGSSRRLLLPEYSPIGLNTTAFSPTFDSGHPSYPPTTVNELLGSYRKFSQGTDTQQSGVSLAGAGALSFPSQSLYTGGTLGVCEPGTFTLPGDLSEIAVGDDVLVTIGGLNSHVKVATVLVVAGDTVITVAPDILIPLDTGEDLDHVGIVLGSSAADIRVTRDTVRVTDSSTPPKVLVTAAGLGFGLGEEALGSEWRVTIPASDLDSQYEVHVGDVVTQLGATSEVVLGEVAKVHGPGDYSLALVSLAVTNAVWQAWGTLRVYPRGFHYYRVISAGLREQLRALLGIIRNPSFTQSGNTYLFSGVGVAQFYRNLDAVYDTVAAISGLLGQYSAVTDRLVGELLENLGKSRNKELASLLLLCKFDTLQGMTTETLSEAARMGDLLAGLADSFGDGSDFVEYAQVGKLFSDFTDGESR